MEDDISSVMGKSPFLYFKAEKARERCGGTG
jgi:hypothetical protein